MALVFVASLTTAAKAEQRVFVRDGEPVNVQYVGSPWVAGDNVIKSIGAQSSLYAADALAEGDYHITARLTLPRQNHRGAAMGIGPFSQIAFDGNGGRMIVYGPLLVPPDQMIQYTIVGRSKNHIDPGVPFKLEVIRKGDEMTILIDGEVFATLPVLQSHNGPISIHPGSGVGELWVHDLSAEGRFVSYKPTHIAAGGARLHPKVRWTPEIPIGVARMNDGGIFKISGNDVRVSHDLGKSWDKWPLNIITEHDVTPGSAVPFCTADGTLIAAFINPNTREEFNWDDELGTATTGRLDVWVMRSVDAGKTWIDVQPLMEGYCGAMSKMIQTSEGNIVLPIQEFMFDEGRHGTRTYVSKDGGSTWKSGNLLDIGGEGNHDGAFEPTVVELPDGRTWMIMRTNLDYLWSAYSDQEGRYWRHTEPSQFQASSSPACALRLDDGRIVLLWNPATPTYRDSYPRRIGKWSENPSSWCREEVLLAVSDADGRRWTEPLVIAQRPGASMAYFSLLEYEPGKLWITSGGIGLRLTVDLNDLLEDITLSEELTDN